MTSTSPHSLAQMLQRRGFEFLGGGVYSSVFAPVGAVRVIKVNHRMDAWVDYVLWATKMGYAGTFAPKVHSLRIGHDFNGDAFYVATMERLKCTVSKSGDEKLMYHASNFDRFAYHCTYKDVPDPIEDTEAAFPGCTKFLREFAKAFPTQIDLHGGNIMVRDNNTLCVTDPTTMRPSDTSPRRMRARDIAWVRNAQFQSQKSMRAQA